MASLSSQHLSPNAAEGVSSPPKHGFIHTLRKSLSSISLSSRRSAHTVSSNRGGPRKQRQGASNIYDDSFDISLVPKDAFASALRDALAFPGQDSPGPYFNGGFEHVRRNYSMFNLSGHAAEATDPDQLARCASNRPNVVDVVPPNRGPVVSPSGCTLQCREARIPLSASAANVRTAANMRTASHENFDGFHDAHYRRSSTSHDWFVDSPMGPLPNNSGVETSDLIGPDPFRWTPTRAHVSEVQRSFQVPESTASGALAITVSSSHEQIPLTSKVAHAKCHGKRRKEVVWWCPERPAFTEDRTSGGGRKGKLQPRDMGRNQYPKTRL